MSPSPCIHISNLSKTYKVADKGLPLKDKLLSLITGRGVTVVNALRSINLEVYPGEFIGIIGQNGSGKTTLMKMILGSIDPDPGATLDTHGKVLRLAYGSGFDDNLSARDNIFLTATILGLSESKINNVFDEIIEFADLKKFINTPIKFFSSGMQSRLSFAIGLHAEADIFLVDEFFADVGDEAFRKKAQLAFERKIKEGKTLLHVTHNMHLIEHHCDKILLVHEGEAKMYYDVEEGIEAYRRL